MVEFDPTAENLYNPLLSLSTLIEIGKQPHNCKLDLFCFVSSGAPKMRHCPQASSTL
jgi:hypothetical protein